jgi:hypothetical protein
MGCHLFLRIDNRCAIWCFIIERCAVDEHTALFDYNGTNVIKSDVKFSTNIIAEILKFDQVSLKIQKG